MTIVKFPVSRFSLGGKKCNCRVVRNDGRETGPSQPTLVFQCAVRICGSVDLTTFDNNTVALPLLQVAWFFYFRSGARRLYSNPDFIVGSLMVSRGEETASTMGYRQSRLCF